MLEQPDTPNVEAAFVILSEELIVADLRVMIGMDPDRSFGRGDPVGKSGRAFQRYSGWEVRVGPSAEAPEAVLGRLLDRLDPVADRVRLAADDPRVAQVSLWIWSEGCEFKSSIAPGDIARLARLGATLQVDAYDIRP